MSRLELFDFQQGAVDTMVEAALGYFSGTPDHGEEGLWLCVPRWLWRFHHADIYVLAWCPDRNDLSEVELVGCISRARFGAERLFTESMGNRGVATYYVEASSLTPIEALLGRIKETRDDEEE